MIAAGKYEGASEDYRNSTGAGGVLNLLCSCTGCREIIGKFYNTSYGGSLTANPALAGGMAKASGCTNSSSSTVSSQTHEPTPLAYPPTLLAAPSPAVTMGMEMYVQNLANLLRITGILPVRTSEQEREDKTVMLGCLHYENLYVNDPFIWNLWRKETFPDWKAKGTVYSPLEKGFLSLCPASFLLLPASQAQGTVSTTATTPLPPLEDLSRHDMAIRSSVNALQGPLNYPPGGNTSLCLLDVPGHSQRSLSQHMSQHIQIPTNLYSSDIGSSVSYKKSQGNIHSWNLNFLSLKMLLVDCLRTGDTSGLPSVLYGGLCAPEFLTDCCQPNEIPYITEVALKLLLTAYLNADAFLKKTAQDNQKREMEKKMAQKATTGRR